VQAKKTKTKTRTQTSRGTLPSTQLVSAQIRSKLSTGADMYISLSMPTRYGVCMVLPWLVHWLCSRMLVEMYVARSG